MVKIGNFFFNYRNLLFPAFYLVLFVPSPVVFKEYTLALGIGLAIIVTGQLIRIITVGLKYIIRGGRDRKVYADDLVTEGLFAHCRNPLYAGNILMLLGLGLIANNFIYLVIIFPIFVFIYQSIVMAEENFLQNKFGNAFITYRNEVNRWLINPKGLSKTLNEMSFHWKRVVLKEYNTTFLWLTGICLLIGYKKEAFYDVDKLIPLSATIIVLMLFYIFVKVKKKTGRWVAD